MAYSKELIDEVKELFPNYIDMIKHAETGSVWLGRYLDDASSSSVDISKVLIATSLKELQDEAKLMLRKRELYVKWCKQDPRRVYS